MHSAFPYKNSDFNAFYANLKLHKLTICKTELERVICAYK